MLQWSCEVSHLRVSYMVVFNAHAFHANGCRDHLSQFVQQIVVVILTPRDRNCYCSVVTVLVQAMPGRKHCIHATYAVSKFRARTGRPCAQLSTTLPLSPAPKRSGASATLYCRRVSNDPMDPFTNSLFACTHVNSVSG